MNITFIKNTRFKIFLTVFLVYLFYIAPGYVTANTNRYILLAKSIVEDKTFNIDKYCASTRDIARYRGSDGNMHIYIGAAPGLGLMAVPFYAILKPLIGIFPNELEVNLFNLFFAFLFAVLPGTAIAVLLYDMLQRFDIEERRRILIVFASAFGTILFYYSTRFMAHVMGGFLLFSAFSILFASKNQVSPQKKLPFFLTGIFLGMAILTEYTLLIGVILLAAYAFYGFSKDKIPHYLFLLSGFLIPACLYMYYHYKCFENPFATAAYYSEMIGPIPILPPKPKIIYELIFGTYRGMFLYMPVLVLAFYGLFKFFTRPDRRYLAEMVLIMALFLSIFFTVALYCNKVWPWGGDFGPRFFIPCIPFLMLVSVFAFKKMGYRTLFSITLLSAFINWCGVQYGDADNVFTDIGLFVLMGPNSNMAQWAYNIAVSYIRKFNVITHFSPLMGLVILAIFIHLIWKRENSRGKSLAY